MKVEITNRTLEPITSSINGASYVIKAGNVAESVDVGEAIPRNLLDLEANGFIRIARGN